MTEPNESTSQQRRRVAAVALEIANFLSLASRQRHAGEIVRMCRVLDDQLNGLPLEQKDMDAVLDEIESFAAFEGYDAKLVDHLRCLRTGIPDGARLPVQADIAQRVIRSLGTRRDADVEELERLTAQDAVLAGAIMQVANSALYSPVERFSRIREAICYLGTETAREVLLAASMRPLFASAGLLRLWKHSVQMAQLCSDLAAQSGILAPDEALLLGLVHDVGALATQTLPAPARARFSRLVEKGCPQVYTEHLLFGRDHGEIGAQILSHWKFPESMIEAVRFHHQPERSEHPTASMVYLAEFWSGLDEDVPSFIRIGECARRTGISLEALSTPRTRSGALHLLREVG